jgi:hypothetical protein
VTRSNDFGTENISIDRDVSVDMLSGQQLVDRFLHFGL